MNNYPLPSDERLEDVIKEAFETSPGPEMAHIYRLEERLIRRLPSVKARPGVNKTPWWIVLVLSAGMASAAWMVSETLFNEDENTEQETMINIATDDNGDSETISENQNPVPEQQFDEQQFSRDDESPIIYQRENF